MNLNFLDFEQPIADLEAKIALNVSDVTFDELLRQALMPLQLGHALSGDTLEIYRRAE